jgi:hypothetical protein
MDIEPPNFAQTDSRLSRDSVGRGCLFGFLCQVAFILVSLLAVFSGRSGNLSVILLASWGVTQWAALIPLILRQRAKGHIETVQGLIIAGCAGLLLSSACAAMFFHY